MVSSLGIRMHIHYANDLCGITEHPATYLAKKHLLVGLANFLNRSPDVERTAENEWV